MTENGTRVTACGITATGHEIEYRTAPRWPEDGSIVPVPDLLGPLERVVREAFEMKPKRKRVTYRGYDANPNPAHCISIVEQFTPADLKRQAEQGRDVLSIALLGAFWLGMEQARRMDRKETAELKWLVDALDRPVKVSDAAP